MPSPTAFVLGREQGGTFDAGPFHIVSRVQGGQSGGLFELYELTLGPGGVVDYHVHTTMDETIHVVEGTAEFNVVGRKTLGGPGATAFVPRGLHHGFRNAGDGPARVLLLFTPARSQNEYFTALEVVFGAPQLDAEGLAAVQKQFDQSLVPAE